MNAHRSLQSSSQRSVLQYPAARAVALLALAAMCFATGIVGHPAASAQPERVPRGEGVCCSVAGFCVMTTKQDCIDNGGQWYPEYTECSREFCRELPCCVGSECRLLSQPDCDAAGGARYVDWLDCTEPTPCTHPLRACCSDDLCELRSRSDCEDSGGRWEQTWITCDPNNCLLDQASCCSGEECRVTIEQDCLDLGGVWHSTWQSCGPNPCRAIDENNLFPGVFICHHDPTIVFSSAKTVCGEHSGISDCSQQNPSVMTDEPVVWYVLSAFMDDKVWALSEFGFGDYPEELFTFTTWGPCAPGQVLELHTEDWPGPNEGTAVTAPDNWRGNFVPVYFFAGYASEMAGRIPLGPDPESGFAGWVDSRPIGDPREQMKGQRPGRKMRSLLPEEFPAQCLPTLGLLTAGTTCCPAPPWEGFGESDDEK